MMEPVDPATLGPLPAPFWFIQFFKVLGFILHMVPMNLWFAGMFLTLVLYRREGPARHWAERMATLMPVIIAFGVNFGIVPLLFIQVAYPWAFYPATILTAWFWLAIIGLLLVAYYGVYAFAFGVTPDRPHAGMEVYSGVGGGCVFPDHCHSFLQRNEPDGSPRKMEVDLAGAPGGRGSDWNRAQFRRFLPLAPLADGAGHGFPHHRRVVSYRWNVL
ncbi:MAG: hypothetical protein KatS3mg112_0466 [Thermogutta sp.]|nr:MAG: hypothetical protein KatS3mg112_0466 [Thermogutta sp.]